MDSIKFRPRETKRKRENKDVSSKPAMALKLKTKRQSKLFKCAVCPNAYTQALTLKYHIRRTHYNMIAKITGRDQRAINETWLERVLNCDAVVEIKKIGPNKYLMKKSSDPNSIHLAETKDTIDITPLYPYARTLFQTRTCVVCKQKLLKHEFKKHLDEMHDDLIL